MNDHTTSKPPIWFWIVSIIALLWNAMGVMQYLQQAYKTDSFKEMSTPEQLEMYANLPSWYTASFALAVFGGAIGCLLLLLRKKMAYPILLVSLIAVLVQMAYLHFSLEMSNIMTLFIVLVAILLAWFSKYSISKGWIK